MTAAAASSAVATTFLCAFSASMFVLIPLRLVQGLSAASGVVISRAIVRDLYHGPVAARFFSRLIMVTGLSPILAPLLGAQLLRFTTWRGVFVALGLLGLAILVAQAAFLPETFPPERRVAGRRRHPALDA